MLDRDTAWELALFAGLDWDDDAAVLAPLVDAEIVWADDELLDAIAAPIVESLWADGLREDIERALRAYGKTPCRAFTDLELGPGKSRLAHAYVRQGAVDLAGGAMLPGVCLCCVEDALASLSAARSGPVVVKAAASLLRRDGETSDAPGAQRRLRELGLLAERSLPRLSAALLELAGGDIDAVLAQC